MGSSGERYRYPVLNFVAARCIFLVLFLIAETFRVVSISTEPPGHTLELTPGRKWYVGVAFVKACGHHSPPYHN